MLCAVITAWIFALVTPQTVYPALWSVVIVGIVGSIVSQMGDLFASLVKRHCKVKDFGTLFPGHGGMMDRIDSILFAGVVVYLFYHLQLLIA